MRLLLAGSVRSQNHGNLMRLPGHRKKLLREGAEGHAVVLESQGVNIVAGGASAFKLLLEVHFSDGSTAELRQKFNLTDARVMISVGDILPIRYDPDDHSAVVIDAPAIRAMRDEKHRTSDLEAVERARRRLKS